MSHHDPSKSPPNTQKSATAKGGSPWSAPVQEAPRLYAQATPASYGYAGGKTFTAPSEANEADITFVNACGVPAALVWGVIDGEKADRGWFEGVGELWKKWRNNPKVSLGLSDMQVERAAELDFPGRDFAKEPLTDEECDALEEKLEDPHENIRYLVRELEDNYNFYGKKPGKTDGDRWRFALAKHKGGHGVVGSAQQKVIEAGGDANRWAEVSQYMDAGVVSFVETIAGPGDGSGSDPIATALA